MHAMDLSPAYSNRGGSALAGAELHQPSSARIPAIRVDAFCETDELLAEVGMALNDRRMARATSGLQVGGASEAIEHYRRNSSPQLIILEIASDQAELLATLDELAAVCEIKTRLVLIGRHNDIDLYRALTRRGVTEYLCMPVTAASLLAAIGDAFSETDASKIGRTYGFVGARGGAGSSVIAHNVAWMLGELSGTSSIVVDLDLPFGTAALDFDIEPEKSLIEAVREPGRIDDQLFEKLITPYDPHFGVLPAPATLDVQDISDPGVFDAVLDVAQRTASHVIMDVPHLWSEWTKRMLIAVDEVVITATPDLASLRNAHNLVHLLRQARPHDPEPKIILNQVGIPKKPELKAARFAEVLEIAPLATIPFDPKVFGTAANAGQLLTRVSGGSRYQEVLGKISRALAKQSTERPVPKGKLRQLYNRLRK